MAAMLPFISMSSIAVEKWAKLEIIKKPSSFKVFGVSFYKGRLLGIPALRGYLLGVSFFLSTIVI